MFQCSDPTETDRLREAVDTARAGGPNLGLAAALQALGANLARDGGNAEALPLLQESATIARASASAESRPVLAAALHGAFNAARGLQRMPLALAALRELNAVRGSMLAAGDATVVAALAEGLMTEALIAGSAGDAAGARAAVEEAVAIRRAEVRRQPGKPAELGLADAVAMLASQCLEAGDRDAAAPLVEEALSLFQAAATRAEPAWQRRVIPLTLKARLAEAAGDLPAAADLVEEAIAIQYVPAGPHADMAAFSRARLFERLAGLRLAGGEPAAAESAIAEAGALLARAVRLPEPVRAGLRATLDGLSAAARLAEDAEAAERLHAGALATLESLAGRMKESERRQAIETITAHWTKALARSGGNGARRAPTRRPAKARQAV